MKPNASIVIRCYNEERHIGRLLEGILCQTVKDVEIIAVDSGSTDRTAAILAQYPVTVLTIRPEDFSFGRALNLGCQAASGEFIIAASAHVYPVTQHWLSQLLEPFTNPRVALVYGKQVGNEGTKYSEHQVFAQWFPNTSHFDQDFPFCNNANAAVRRVLWEHLRYDEQLSGLEDIDWARRAMNIGYKIAYKAEAAIVHVHDEPWAGVCNRYLREAMALKRIFPHEQFYWWDFTRLFIANAAADSFSAWRDGVLWHHWKSILMFRLMQFWGTYRGFKSRGGLTGKLRRRLYYPPEKRGEKMNEDLLTTAGGIDYDSVSYHNSLPRGAYGVRREVRSHSQFEDWQESSLRQGGEEARTEWPLVRGVE
ncbi:MAG: glycosyltransferase family A protein [Planctomycetaceae bacterium]